MSLKERLATLRERHGYKMTDIATKTGVPYMSYVNWEKNGKEPSLAAVTKLAKFYNITIDELLGNARKPESQLTKALRLIEMSLSQRAVPAADMEQMAEGQGISPKTLQRAKSALGVISTKRGDKWYWVLPIEAAYAEVVQEGQDSQHSQDSQDAFQDGHEKNVTALTTLTIFNTRPQDGPGMEG